MLLITPIVKETVALSLLQFFIPHNNLKHTSRYINNGSSKLVYGLRDYAKDIICMIVVHGTFVSMWRTITIQSTNEANTTLEHDAKV